MKNGDKICEPLQLQGEVSHGAVCKISEAVTKRERKNRKTEKDTERDNGEVLV